ncbi:hypothetical protein KOM00_08205 [Geomonas sp. Red69]|uniref:Lipoprotein n=1 Tax=Geomonas diazotrophica TaxID=2843197 RepID=A0ABX8JPC9_9BACT|nr:MULTISPECIES: hypothetical protein [Geomonas]MBU5636715.1 hypothetical protein [Geomonas diazotrophica]QWV98469.1 hypothetical protein KP005_04060 [Geomonas nitrogeniifigens]QXE87652.1 hypothetical protein KP003_04420 [Geomonas nitrogeniifigens]
MKNVFFSCTLLLMTLITGCGSDDLSIVPQPATHPTITSSNFVNDTAGQKIDVTLGFNAPVDDLAARTAYFTNAQGIEVFREQPGVDAPAQRSGILTFSESYAGFAAGTYTLTVYISNMVAGSSNRVTYTFTK